MVHKKLTICIKLQDSGATRRTLRPPPPSLTPLRAQEGEKGNNFSSLGFTSQVESRLYPTDYRKITHKETQHAIDKFILQCKI